MPSEHIDWTGVRMRRVVHRKNTVVFAQGDTCADVLYLEQGSVRISVISHAGKEATVAVLAPDNFFGEGCLSGQPLRIATATAATACTVVEIAKDEFRRQMLAKPVLAARFLSHMLTRNARIEEDLIDQPFNDVEKRLARALLLLARFGEDGTEHRTLPRVTQTVLAEMIGATRSRVNRFMTKFRRLGFIEYNGALQVHNSLLTVLLRDAPPSKSGATPASDAKATKRRTSGSAANQRGASSG